MLCNLEENGNKRHIKPREAHLASDAGENACLEKTNESRVSQVEQACSQDANALWSSAVEISENESFLSSSARKKERKEKKEKWEG